MLYESILYQKKTEKLIVLCKKMLTLGKNFRGYNIKKNNNIIVDFIFRR